MTFARLNEGLEERVRAETMRYITDSLERCGGECLLSVRRVSKMISARLGLKRSKFVNDVVNQTLKGHPLAVFYGYSHRRGKPNNPVVAMIYQLKSPSIEELAAAANVGVSV